MGTMHYPVAEREVTEELADPNFLFGPVWMAYLRILQVICQKFKAEEDRRLTFATLLLISNASPDFWKKIKRGILAVERSFKDDLILFITTMIAIRYSMTASRKPPTYYVFQLGLAYYSADALNRTISAAFTTLHLEQVESALDQFKKAIISALALRCLK